MNNLKTAIVGANGQVGSELIKKFVDADLNAIGVVRNSLGAGKMDFFDVPHIKSDITVDDQAREALSDVNVVIITPWISPNFDGVPDFKRSARINKTLIKNCVEYSSDDSLIIYFSSLVAYGKDIGLKDSNYYGQSKRKLENWVEKLSNFYDKSYYNLRLGHVYGPHQLHTKRLIRDHSLENEYVWEVEEEKDFNVVTIETLYDSIMICMQEIVQYGTYGVVESPQLTWKQIAEEFIPRQIRFVQKPKVSFERYNIRGLVWNKIFQKGEFFKSQFEDLFMPHLPHSLNVKIQQKYRTNNFHNIISKNHYRHKHFDYGAMPDPTLPKYAKHLL
jgi:nucleoside-diphosphate-sugar epimerase